MAVLPISPLPTATVEVSGTSVTIRSLSRDEVATLAALEGDASAAETFILSRSTGATEEESTQWRKEVTAKVVSDLLNDIAVLSGLRASKTSAGKA